MKYAVGVDIGGTSIKIGLVEKTGKLINSWEIPTNTRNSGKNIIPDIASFIQTILQKVDQPIEGIGLAVPGPVCNNGQVNHCLNLGWKQIFPGEELSELIKKPTVVGNDGTMAAVGEMWQGAGKGFQDIVMITLGTGVGGGIIVAGRPLIGKDGAAGEIGHIPMNPMEKERCVCGGFGCLEQYASATALTSYAEQLLRDGSNQNSMLRTMIVNPKNIMECAIAGDETALQSVRFLAEALGRGAAAITAILNPQVFIVGGGLSNAGDSLITKIQQSYSKYAFHASCETPFKRAELGNYAAVIGGAKYCFDRSGNGECYV